MVMSRRARDRMNYRQTWYSLSAPLLDVGFQQTHAELLAYFYTNKSVCWPFPRGARTSFIFCGANKRSKCADLVSPPSLGKIYLRSLR